MGSDRVLLLLVALLGILGLVALLASEDPAPTAAPGLPAEELDDPGGRLEGRRPTPPSKPAEFKFDKELMKSPEALRKAILEQMDERRRKAIENAVAVEGIVLDHAGHSVAGAQVYQLPSASAEGGYRGVFTPHTTSDAGGRFTIQAQKPMAESIFVAKTKQSAPGWIPGSDVGPGRSIRIVLPEPTELDVFLVDTDGKPLAGEGVRVVPMTARGVARPLPGPGGPEPERFDATDKNGRVRFRFGRSMPVVVIPELEGWVSDPKERWLPDSDGTLTFTVQKGCTLVVKAVDAEAGTVLEKSVWASVLDPETGRELMAGSSDQPGGTLRAELPLLPGLYDVLVTMRGREPTLVQGVRVDQAGAVIEVTARMGPLSEAATLSLVLPPPPPVDTDGRRSRGRGRIQPIVFVLRTDGGYDRHGWVRRADARPPKGKADMLAMTMRPGSYEVVVMNPNTARVAHLRGVSLAPGGELTRQVTLRAGVQFQLYDVVPADVQIRSVRVLCSGVGRFPSAGYDVALSGSLRSFGGLMNNLAPAGSKARKSPKQGPMLGPYPGASLVAEVTDWEGDTHRYPVRAK